MQAPQSQLLKFNGQDSYLILDQADNLGLSNASYTLEFWAYPIEEASPSTEGYTLLSAVDDTQPEQLLITLDSVGRPTIQVSGIIISGRAPLAKSCWVHLALSYDLATQTYTFYQNGIVLGTRTEAGPYPVASASVALGYAPPEGSPSHFHGHFYEVRIWNTVRNQAALYQNMFKPIDAEHADLGYYLSLNITDASALLTAAGTEEVGQGELFGNFQYTSPTEVPVPERSQVLTLDGATAYAIVEDHPRYMLETYTLETWLYPTGPHPDATSAFTFIFGKTGKNFVLAYQTAKEEFISLTFSTPNTPHRLTWLASQQEGLDSFVNQWVHVAMTHTGTGIQLFINGNLVAEENELPVQLPLEGEITIGRKHGADGGHFAGHLSEMRLWNYARSPQEINDLMRATLGGTEDGLVGYWPMDLPTGNILRSSRFSAFASSGTRPYNLEPEAVENPPVASFWPGAALLFEGAENNLTFPAIDPLPPGQPIYTLEVWVKWPKVQSVPLPTYTYTREIIKSSTFSLVLNDSNPDSHMLAVALKRANDGGLQSIQSHPLEPDTWYHVTIAYEGASAVYFYINGVKAAAVVPYPGSEVFAGPYAISGLVPEDGLFEGQVAELRTWAGIRDEDAVKKDMHHTLSGNEAGLLSYYPFSATYAKNEPNKASFGPAPEGTLYRVYRQAAEVPVWGRPPFQLPDRETQVAALWTKQDGISNTIAQEGAFRQNQLQLQTSLKEKEIELETEGNDLQSQLDNSEGTRQQALADQKVGFEEEFTNLKANQFPLSGVFTTLLSQVQAAREQIRARTGTNYQLGQVSTKLLYTPKLVIPGVGTGGGGDSADTDGPITDDKGDSATVQSADQASDKDQATDDTGDTQKVVYASFTDYDTLAAGAVELSALNLDLTSPGSSSAALEKRTVPDVTQYTRQQAESKLVARGFLTQVSNQTLDDTPENRAKVGRVQQQVPAAGTEKGPKTTVTLIIASIPATA